MARTKKENTDEIIQEEWNLPVKKEIVETWIDEYGKIYKSVIDGDIYLWRRLKRSEYINIITDEDLNSITNNQVKIFKRQEMITEKSVLYPSNIASIFENSAGLATVLSDEIILNSGFDMPSTESIGDVND